MPNPVVNQVQSSRCLILHVFKHSESSGTNPELAFICLDYLLSTDYKIALEQFTETEVQS